MNKKSTKRGFGIYEFTDRYDVECSLQKSSLATEDAIWLGCNGANTRECVRGKGWIPIVYSKDRDICFDTRMHLTQEQVKELLPILTKFVKTGSI